MGSDGLLILLRALSLGALVALTWGLVYLLAVRGGSLSPMAWRAWVAIAVTRIVFTVVNTYLQFRWLIEDVAPDSAIVRVGRQLYNLGFLLNAVLDAGLPFLLLLFCGSQLLVRRVAAVMTVVVILVGATWLMAGALRSWDDLLTAGQIITFLGLAGYLTFCGFWILGRLPGVDVYLAGFLAISTLFNLLLPVQEVFFQLVGRTGAQEIWHLNQFLQFASDLAQLAIVLALTNALAKGSGIRTHLSVRT